MQLLFRAALALLLATAALGVRFEVRTCAIEV